MRALIFAAGRGMRMRPLTDATPKPLLQVGGKRLIEWHLEKLAAAGIVEVVINTAHLADQFPPALGDGTRWGMRIAYSYEGAQALETGGGMLRALPLLGDEPFIAVNGDIWTDFDFSTLPQNPPGLAHLVLVDNPAQHPQGDFALMGVRVSDAATPANPASCELLTFAGIGVYRPQLLDAQTPPGVFSIVPILRAAMRANQISGEHYRGTWNDIGTPARLVEVNARLAGKLQPPA